MNASVRHYSVDAERVDELMHRVDERFAPRLEQMPGFVAYQAIVGPLASGAADRPYTYCTPDYRHGSEAEGAPKGALTDLADLLDQIGKPPTSRPARESGVKGSVKETSAWFSSAVAAPTLASRRGRRGIGVLCS